MQLLPSQHCPQMLPHLPVGHAVEQEDKEALEGDGHQVNVTLRVLLLLHLAVLRGKPVQSSQADVIQEMPQGPLGLPSRQGYHFLHRGAPAIGQHSPQPYGPSWAPNFML